MSRKSLYLGLAVFTLAALVSACSKNSPMGPSEDATASLQRTPVAVPEPACTQAQAVAPDMLWASTNMGNAISFMFKDHCTNEEGFVINYAKIDHRPESPGYGPRQQMYLSAWDEAANGEWVTPVISGLDSGFNYRIWVEVYNCAGTVQSVVAIGNTLYREAAEEEDDQLTPPQAPEQLFASKNGTDMISIIFRDMSDNEAEFVVKVAIMDTRASSPGIRLVKTVSLEASAGSGELVTGEINGLESGCIYRVWVEATNAAGSSRSNLAFGETDLVEEEDDDRLVASREGYVYQATPAGS